MYKSEFYHVYTYKFIGTRSRNTRSHNIVGTYLFICLKAYTYKTRPDTRDDDGKKTF